LPGGIDFQKGFLWANCICGSTHLVKLDLYPEYIRSYLRFLVTHFKGKYASGGKSDEDGDPAGMAQDGEDDGIEAAGPTQPDW
jgi:hypothetical protein